MITFIGFLIVIFGCWIVSNLMDIYFCIKENNRFIKNCSEDIMRLLERKTLLSKTNETIYNTKN